MPAFGDHASSALLPGDELALEKHRKAERSRMARPRQSGILKESERLQVYIYNVGPFSRKLDTLGSLGMITIPGLPETDVLKGLTVAGPLIRQGLPAEPYPGEPRGQWIEPEIGPGAKWIDADGEVFMLAERPGIDEALRIIGGHEQSAKNPYAASPYEQGCFVSVIPEQKVQPKEPKEPGEKASREQRKQYAKDLAEYEDGVRDFLKWQASVEAAQERFTKWAMRRGEEQSLAYANGTYQRDEELFVLSRIFQKTEKDWPFLSGTAPNTKTKACWSCGRAVAVGVPKCQCGELQISQAEYEARRRAVHEGATVAA